MSLSISGEINSYSTDIAKRAVSGVEKNFKNVINQSIKDLEEEEDKILYQQLKQYGVNLDKHPLEWQKQHIKTLGFPPLSAPASIRKAWRENTLSLSNTQKQQLNHDIALINLNLTAKDKTLEQKMKNTDFSYSNYIDTMLSMADELKDLGYFHNYSLTTTFLTNFKNELHSK